MSHVPQSLEVMSVRKTGGKQSFQYTRRMHGRATKTPLKSGFFAHFSPDRPTHRGSIGRLPLSPGSRLSFPYVMGSGRFSLRAVARERELGDFSHELRIGPARLPGRHRE